VNGCVCTKALVFRPPAYRQNVSCLSAVIEGYLISNAYFYRSPEKYAARYNYVTIGLLHVKFFRLV